MTKESAPINDKILIQMPTGCWIQQVARNESVFCTREQKANTTRGNRVQNTRPAVAGTNAQE